MARTQNISLESPIFELIVVGDWMGWDTNGDPKGAIFPLAPLPLDRIPEGVQLVGQWTIRTRVYGEIHEHYDLLGAQPFPDYNSTGLWGELAAHHVRGLITRVDYEGPDGWTDWQETTLETFVDENHQVYLGQLDGSWDGVISFQCGVNNVGNALVQGWFMGDPLPWQPYHERADDQHTPPSGQFAEITITETGAAFSVSSGGDERFNALADVIWSLPLKVRVQVPDLDMDGHPSPSKDCFVLFGPLFGTNVRASHPRMKDWLFPRRTPVDEVFDFPLAQQYQKTMLQHVFLENYSGNPDPPFPREHVWGQRELLSGLRMVAVAYDRSCLGLNSPAWPLNEFQSQTEEQRTWPQSRFHAAGEVTERPLATLTLSSSKPISTGTWTSVGGSVSGHTFTAGGSATFSTNVSAMECRPYRRMSWNVSCANAGTIHIILKQQTDTKEWFVDVDSGDQTFEVDLCDPQVVNGTNAADLSPLDGTNCGAASPESSLAGRFSGVGGLSEISLGFAANVVTLNSLNLTCQVATVEQTGGGLPGRTPNEGMRHCLAFRVDDRDAGRTPYDHFDLLTFLDDLADRHNLTVSDVDDSMPEAFQHRFDSWRLVLDPFDIPLTRVPQHQWRYVSNLSTTLVRPQPRNLLTGAEVRTTLVGTGFALHPAIGEDAIFSDYGLETDPFVCRFDSLWGWGVRTTAFGGGAHVTVRRPGQWSYGYSASSFGKRGDLPVTDANSGVEVDWFADPAFVRNLHGESLRQTYWIGVLGSESAKNIHSAEHKHGHIVAEATQEKLELVRSHPRLPERRSDPLDIQLEDVQIARSPGGWTEAVWVVDDSVDWAWTARDGDTWSEPMSIAAGEEVALAICPQTGVTVVAIWAEGAWTAHRRRTRDAAFEVAGTITLSDKVRAGLEFTSGGDHSLMFSVPVEGEVKGFRSTDWGGHWTEVI